MDNGGLKHSDANKRKQEYCVAREQSVPQAKATEEDSALDDDSYNTFAIVKIGDLGKTTTRKSEKSVKLWAELQGARKIEFVIREKPVRVLRKRKVHYSLNSGPFIEPITHIRGHQQHIQHILKHYEFAKAGDSGESHLAYSKGHVFGDTHISGKGIAFQGDIDSSTTNNTTIYMFQETRSRLEILVMSFLGAAAFCVPYAFASSYRAGNTAECANTRSPLIKLCRSDTESTVDYCPAAVLSCDKVLLITDCSQLCPATVAPAPQHQLMSCEPVFRVCNRVFKEKCSATLPSLQDTSTIEHKNVLVFSRGEARTKRFKLFAEKLVRRCEITFCRTMRMALAMASRPQATPSAILVRDQSIIYAPQETSSLEYQFLEKLREFTRNGGNTVFLHDCTPPIGCLVIAFFADFWNLQWKLPKASSATHFLVSPTLAGQLAVALSYHFRSVRKQLTDLMHKTKSVVRLREETLPPVSIQGPRPRSTSERFFIFVKYGKGTLGFLGKVGSKEDTSRIIFTMLGLVEPVC